jgi:hypothetical protein
MKVNRFTVELRVEEVDTSEKEVTGRVFNSVLMSCPAADAFGLRDQIDKWLEESLELVATRESCGLKCQAAAIRRERRERKERPLERLRAMPAKKALENAGAVRNGGSK